MLPSIPLKFEVPRPAAAEIHQPESGMTDLLAEINMNSGIRFEYKRLNETRKKLLPVNLPGGWSLSVAAVVKQLGYRSTSKCILRYLADFAEPHSCESLP